jgi:branched-chain amino acid transport system permease protein
VTLTRSGGGPADPAAARPPSAPHGQPGRSRSVRRIDRLTDLAIAGFLWVFRIAVLLIVLVGSIATLASGKYSLETWVDLVGNGLALGSIYALIALGYTMVYGILRMINFAHGEIFTAGAFAGYFMALALGGTGLLNANPVASLLSIGLMIVVAMATSTVLAIGLERIAYRRLRTAPRLVPLISAIGASFFLQYTFRGLFGPGIYAYPDVAILGEQVPIEILNMRWVDVLVIVSALLMMSVLYLFVMRTRLGTSIRAVSEDRDTAALMGIDANRAIVLTFAIGAAMAGAAGVLYGLKYTQVYFFSGFVPGIKAFTAAVLGGIGNVPGAMLGGMFLGLIESVGPTLFLDGLNVPSPNQLKDVIGFTMLVLVLVFRPSGILGERVARARA